MKNIYIDELEDIFCNLLENGFFHEAQCFIDCGLMPLMNSKKISNFACDKENLNILRFLFENKYKKPNVFGNPFNYIYDPQRFLNLNYALLYSFTKDKYASAAYLISRGADIHHSSDAIIYNAYNNEKIDLLKYLINSGLYNSNKLYENFLYTLDFIKPQSAFVLLNYIFYNYLVNYLNGTLEKDATEFNAYNVSTYKAQDIAMLGKLREELHKLCMLVTTNKHQNCKINDAVILSSPQFTEQFFLQSLTENYLQITHTLFLSKPQYDYAGKQNRIDSSWTSKIAKKKVLALEIFISSLKRIPIHDAIKVLIRGNDIRYNTEGFTRQQRITDANDLLIKSFNAGYRGIALAVLETATYSDLGIYDLCSWLCENNYSDIIHFIINNKLIYEKRIDDILKISLLSQNLDLSRFLLISGADIHSDNDSILLELCKKNLYKSLDYLCRRKSYNNFDTLSKALKVACESKADRCVKLITNYISTLSSIFLKQLNSSTQNSVSIIANDVLTQINKGPIFIGENHNSDTARKIIKKLIEKKLVIKLFLEIPACNQDLQNILSTQSNNKLTLNDNHLLKRYRDRHYLYEFSHQLSIIELVQYAYSNHIQVYFHDVWPSTTRTESFAIPPPKISEELSLELKHRNIYGGRVFKKFTQDNVTANNVVILVGASHLYKQMCDDITIQDSCGFSKIKVYDFSGNDFESKD